MTGNNILVTGLSGLIGTALRVNLEGSCKLSALNRNEVLGIPTTQASIDDYDKILPAFSDINTVVHLAARISDDAGWESLLKTNIEGTRNVFEAARVNGVKRIVFTSSGATVAGWEKVEPYKSLVEGHYDKVNQGIELIDESMAVRPGNLYASTKVWGESIARHYADSFGIEVVCLRIGYANAEDQPVNARHFSVWNSQRDVVQAIRLAMTAELPENFDIFFILSANKHTYRNIDRAKSVLGFMPADEAEFYR